MVNPFNPATPISSVYSTSGGMLLLNITATPSQYASACSHAPYVSSQLVSQTYSALHGYFEARIKVAAIKGTTAAFWLMDSSTWPPEIDIVEIVTPTSNGDQLAAQTLWFMDQTTVQNVKFASQGFDASQWHTYGVDWQSGTTTFYVDRVATLSHATPSGYTQPMFPILSFETGGSWSGSIPAGTHISPVDIDYVKVWTTKPF